MVKKTLISFTGLLFSHFFLFAGRVDTVEIRSSSMHKTIKCVVVKPASYKKKKLTFPVVYLLHGYSGNYANWINRVPELKKYSDEFNLLIVCPDGAYSSWYFDSPLDSSFRYETHIYKEVVNFIDSNYRTRKDPLSRAITGLSMGGHGALYIALRHPDVFGAAGSMSGGVDLKESKNRFDISKRIGDTINYAKEWYNRSVVGLIDNYAETPVKIIFDCGVTDFFIGGNRLLHKKMLDLKIDHDYIERAGEHNWDYWRNSILFQLTYFNKYFNQIILINGG